MFGSRGMFAGFLLTHRTPSVAEGENSLPSAFMNFYELYCKTVYAVL